MKLIEVTDSITSKLFLDITSFIYKNDPVWVRPLDNDINAIFDPKINKFFSFGSAKRWILLDDNNKTIGRVAAFINNHKLTEDPTGGMGFFECIDDQSAADILFNKAKEWLLEQGMSNMEGPINFGENDSWWGLLIDGFIHPSFGMQYNPPYYQRLFENYGFTISYKQFTNTIYGTELPKRLKIIADRIISKPGYTFKPFKISQLEKFAGDFEEIYNDAWKNFENFTPITREITLTAFKSMKPIIDENIIWFAYYNDEPVSFIIAVPDANQILKHLNGKLDLISKLKFVYHKWMGTMDRIRVIVMGTKTDFQNKGLESAIFRKLEIHVSKENHYKEVELSWVGDFNTKMQAIHEALGGVRIKTHATYKMKISNN